MSAEPVRAENDAAHRLAEQFARDGRAKPTPQPERSPQANRAPVSQEAERAARRKAEEADMLARARAEADARAAAAAAAAASIPVITAAPPATSEKGSTEAADAEPALTAEQARLQRDRDAELDRLSRRLRLGLPSAGAPHPTMAEGDTTLSGQPRVYAAPGGETLIHKQPGFTPGFTKPTDRIAPRLELAPSSDARQQASGPARAERWAAREAPAAQAPTASATSTPTSVAALPSAIADGHHVTLVIVMKPGDRGIRRHNKTADPVLCTRSHCYISRGPNEPALRVSRWDALGTFNTLGGRAGACRNQLGCVFRGVDLRAAATEVQPIDLRIMRHDRRAWSTVAADHTCRLTAAGRGLACDRAVQADSYRMWVIPERLAETAGSDALEAVMRDEVASAR